MTIHDGLTTAGYTAARTMPSRTATIVVTALFGIFGAIPAAIHGGQAERMGGSSKPYWMAFGITLVVSVLLYVLLFASLLGAMAAAVSSAG